MRLILEEPQATKTGNGPNWLSAWLRYAGFRLRLTLFYAKFVTTRPKVLGLMSLVLTVVGFSSLVAPIPDHLADWGMPVSIVAGAGGICVVLYLLKSASIANVF